MIKIMENPVDVNTYYQPGEFDRLKDSVAKGYSYTIKQMKLSVANDKINRLIRR